VIEIEVHVAKLVQLFNNIDAAPFASRDLDPRAERFIVDSAKDLPRDASFGLAVHVGRTPGDTTFVGEAVHAHFRQQSASATRRLRESVPPRQDQPRDRPRFPRRCPRREQAGRGLARPRRHARCGGRLNCSSTTGGRSAPKRGLSTVWHPSGARGQVLIIIDGNSRWYISSRRIRSVAANPPHRVPCASLLFTYNPISSAVG